MQILAHPNGLKTKLASFPGPQPALVTQSMEVWGETGTKISCEWRKDIKDYRKSLILHGHTGSQNNKKSVKVSGKIPHVSSQSGANLIHTKQWTCSWSNNIAFHSANYIMLTWDHVPRPPCFLYCKWRKSGQGLRRIMAWNWSRKQQYWLCYVKPVYATLPEVTCMNLQRDFQQ